MTDIHLDPPNGIPPALIGMPFEQAVEAVAVWGEVRVVGPFAPDPTVKIQALDHEDSALRVLWRSVDVFRTPARELLEMFSGMGYHGDVSNPEERAVLDLTIVFSRWTSQDVPLDPEDGLPRFFTAVLVSDENPATG